VGAGARADTTGPFNLTTRTATASCGRARLPALMRAHPPYYFDFVERYGFQPARRQHRLALTSPRHPALQELVRQGQRASAGVSPSVPPTCRTEDEPGASTSCPTSPWRTCVCAPGRARWF
jgi:hypothetical protein